MTHSNFGRSWKLLSSFKWSFAAILLASTAFSQPPSPISQPAFSRSSDGLEPTNDSENDPGKSVDYLTRGPMHEAFAAPYQPDPEASAIVANQPPEPINEVPPNYRPDGHDVVWIPGYWSWDEERTDFIWISGIWRDLPPNQQWISGYWQHGDEGYYYVVGFWASNEAAEIAYLPTPPRSIDEGPQSPSPGEDYFYVPGSWMFQNDQYQWHPGYWSAVQENWVWTPTRYTWTPRGCVYQAGYWDYDVPHRGVLFAPVYYSQPVYRNPNYSYRPLYSINTGLGLFANLFVQPGNFQYYYGDYYGSEYSDRYFPWVTRFQGSRHFDPFYSSYMNRRPGSFSGASGLGGNNLLSWLEIQNRFFANNVQYRPARTISGQRQFITANRNSGIDPTALHLASIGNSFEQLVRSNDQGVDFQQLNDVDLEGVREDLNPRRKLARERSLVENIDQRGTIHIDGRLDASSAKRDRNGVAEQTMERTDILQSFGKKGGQLKNVPGRATEPVESNRGRADIGSQVIKKAGGNLQSAAEQYDLLKKDRATESSRERAGSDPTINSLNDLMTVRPESVPGLPARDRSRPAPNSPGEDAAGRQEKAIVPRPSEIPQNRLAPQPSPAKSPPQRLQPSPQQRLQPPQQNAPPAIQGRRSGPSGAASPAMKPIESPTVNGKERDEKEPKESKKGRPDK